MARLIKVAILLGVVGMFVLAVGFGFLLIISGGDPVSFVRTGLIRLSLASRQDDLERSAGLDTTDQLVRLNWAIPLL